MNGAVAILRILFSTKASFGRYEDEKIHKFRKVMNTITSGKLFSGGTYDLG